MTPSSLKNQPSSSSGESPDKKHHIEPATPKATIKPFRHCRTGACDIFAGLHKKRASHWLFGEIDNELGEGIASTVNLCELSAA